MKRRFLVPVAVALVLHAILLFGFRRGDPVVIPAKTPDFVCGLTPVDMIKVEPPPDPADTDPSTASKGKPDETRPELPELPVREPFAAITIPVSIPNPRPPDSRLTMSTEPWGDPKAEDRFGPHRTGTFTPDHLDNPPRTRSQPAPVYPYEAKINGRPGEVLVEFVVDETGHVLDPHVLHSNDPIFEAPTLRAVAMWRFEPGRKNGRIVRFRMAVPVGYSINQ